MLLLKKTKRACFFRRPFPVLASPQTQREREARRRGKRSNKGGGGKQHRTRHHGSELVDVKAKLHAEDGGRAQVGETMGVQGIHDGALALPPSPHRVLDSSRRVVRPRDERAAARLVAHAHEYQGGRRAGALSLVGWQVFKWVRKAERCEFKGDAENGEGDDSSFGQDRSAATFETEAEAGQRRLTRGKAADMGADLSSNPFNLPPPSLAARNAVCACAR
jgi:hypothetical protein